MESLVLSKYNELIIKFNKMNLSQCYALACMGIMRTTQLIPYIVKHDEWKELQIMYNFMFNNIEAIVDHTKQYDNYDEVVAFFEESSGLIEDYNCNNWFDHIDHSIMGLIYMLFEEWYYFLNLIDMECEEKNINNLVSYFTLPIRFLDDYLSNLYYDKSNVQSELQEKVENDLLIKEEMDRIDSDLNYVKNNQSMNKIKERVKEYMKLDIISKQ